MTRSTRLLPILAPLLCLAAQPPAQNDVQFGEDWLVIDPVGRAGRSAVRTDAVEAAIVRGTFRAPSDGLEVDRGDGRTATWRAQKPAEGRISGRRGGYAFTVVESPREGVAILETKRHGLVYVNGELRTGNPYGADWYRVPVRLRKGPNEFLFQFVRGPIEPKLVAAHKPVSFGSDHTLPDLIAGEETRTWLGVVVVNARAEPLSDATITIQGQGIGADALSQLGKQNLRVPAIPAFGVYKCCVPVRGPVPDRAGEAKVTLELLRLGSKGVIPEGGGLQDTLPLTLAVREPLARHRRVYRSPVDGSAQYYAVNPPIGDRAAMPGKALFLSLHGAGVEAWGQAAAYSHKSWGYLAAATNRRPYGFDWEDWGRLDAMHVLEDALARFPIDRSRVYLTGHSMGGHGTWQIGAWFPDRFAAIGPSAGWASFDSYTGGRRRGAAQEPTAMDLFLRRAAARSDTLALKRNYAQQGVFIVHGDQDRSVPVREARDMAAALRPFHPDLRVHEQAGAGHWWDGDPEPGAACVDFQPMFDFFARRRLPAPDEVRMVDFTTVDPGVSDRCHWVRVTAQQRRLLPSRVEVRFDPLRRGFAGKTTNVASFELAVAGLPPGEEVTLNIDGQELRCTAEAGKVIRLGRSGGSWSVAPSVAAAEVRTGPFKRAFRRDFLLVVCTGGSEAENRWAMAKARYDAETFWYRGNGAVEIVTDRRYEPRRYPGRSVILYGNAANHGAWATLLGASPVQVDRERVRVGEREIRGEDLACLFVRPHPGDPNALVGVVSGTGLAGLRLNDRMPYFVSGAHFPDVFVTGSDMLEKGSVGVRGAGFFGPDWRVETGEFVWR